MSTGARAHDKTPAGTIATIAQVMTDRHSGLEGGGVAGAQNRFGFALDQRDLSFQHIDQFVLGAMPMFERGLRPRRQNLDQRAKLRQPGRFADPVCARRPAISSGARSSGMNSGGVRAAPVGLFKRLERQSCRKLGDHIEGPGRHDASEIDTSA